MTEHPTYISTNQLFIMKNIQALESDLHEGSILQELLDVPVEPQARARRQPTSNPKLDFVECSMTDGILRAPKMTSVQRVCRRARDEIMETLDRMWIQPEKDEKFEVVFKFGEGAIVCNEENC